ncbi:hypothetical protein MHYP_G00226900 [Metynnis hypsauchen]
MRAFTAAVPRFASLLLRFRRKIGDFIPGRHRSQTRQRDYSSIEGLEVSFCPTRPSTTRSDERWADGKAPEWDFVSPALQHIHCSPFQHSLYILTTLCLSRCDQLSSGLLWVFELCSESEWGEALVALSSPALLVFIITVSYYLPLAPEIGGLPSTMGAALLPRIVMSFLLMISCSLLFTLPETPRRPPPSFSPPDWQGVLCEYPLRCCSSCLVCVSLSVGHWPSRPALAPPVSQPSVPN